MDVKFIELPADFDPSRPRRMGFSFGDIKKITRALNGPLLGGTGVPGAERSVWVRLWSLDPDALSTVCYWGLFRFDPEITTEKVDELIYGYNVRTKDPMKLVSLVMDALRAGGHLPEDKDKPVAPGSSPSSPPAGSSDPLAMR